MKFRAIIHEAEEGGYWAEVPALPGCATQGETYEELVRNLEEAIEGFLLADIRTETLSSTDKVVEIAV